jgi:3',5'-nucleoside bisphosphate phosphatase
VLGVEIENLSSVDVTLQNQTGFTLHNNNDMIVLKAGDKTTIEVKTIERKSEVSLNFLVLSAVNAPNRHPSITIKTKIEATPQQ